MQDTITTIYCVCAEVLESQGFQEDKQRHFSEAEVMTVPLVAALFYGGNHALTRRFLHQHGYTRNTLSASRFCRRLAQVPTWALYSNNSIRVQTLRKHKIRSWVFCGCAKTLTSARYSAITVTSSR